MEGKDVEENTIKSKNYRPSDGFINSVRNYISEDANAGEVVDYLRDEDEILYYNGKFPLVKKSTLDQAVEEVYQKKKRDDKFREDLREEYWKGLEEILENTINDSVDFQERIKGKEPKYNARHELYKRLVSKE